MNALPPLWMDMPLATPPESAESPPPEIRAVFSIKPPRLTTSWPPEIAEVELSRPPEETVINPAGPTDALTTLPPA